MPVRLLVAVAVAAGALLAAGCGAQAGSDVSSADFSDPAQQAVSAAVGDFADAARSRDYTKICSDYLTAPLVKQLDAAKGTKDCAAEIKRSLRDVDKTDLAVRKIAIKGTDAVAVVQPTGTGEVEKQASLGLVKEGARWKLSGIG